MAKETLVTEETNVFQEGKGHGENTWEKREREATNPFTERFHCKLPATSAGR